MRVGDVMADDRWLGIGCTGRCRLRTRRGTSTRTRRGVCEGSWSGSRLDGGIGRWRWGS